MVWSSPLPDIQSVLAEPSKETSSLPQRAACEAANHLSMPAIALP